MSYLTGLRPDIATSQDLSLSALNYTTSIDRRFRLLEITFKFSQSVTETITITKDSKQGANYDSPLRTITISGETSYIFKPDGEEEFQSGDELKLQCTNSGGAGVVYIVIKTREILQ